jgi:hypothetical protein
MRQGSAWKLTVSEVAVCENSQKPASLLGLGISVNTGALEASLQCTKPGQADSGVSISGK